MTRTDPTIAVIFDRFGPYHVARLNALAAEVRVIGIEMFGETLDYDWEKVRGPLDFERHTLFPNASADCVDRAVLCKDLRGLLDRLSPDFVAVPGWSDLAALVATRWCFDNEVPSILMAESTAMDARRSPLVEFIKRNIVSFHSAALVGGRLHRAYLEDLKFPTQGIYLGYDVVDNAHFAPAEDRTRLPKNGYLLTSARFIEKKNLIRLIAAYATSAAERVRGMPSLLLVGGGPLEGEIRAAVEKYSLADKVVLAGWLQYEQLPTAYAGAIALIHPSTVEQWGLVVNEAMAAGLPVLVSEHCGCAPDLVEDGVNGLTFDPTSTQDIAASINRFLAMPHSERLRMGQHSLVRIAKFGPRRFAEGMVNAIGYTEQSKGTPGLLARLLMITMIKLRRLRS